MKLYTEEQVREAIKLADKLCFLLDFEEEGIMSLLKPIELPSDEEIEASKYPENSPEQELYNDGWGDGIKWLIDKIQGGSE